MKPNEAWLDFLRQTGFVDHPSARALFLAGFQAGIRYAECALHSVNSEAMEEITKTVHAFEDAENGRAHRA